MSPLAAAGRAFDLLIEPPTSYVFDGTGFAGLPQRELDLRSLRRVLLATATTPPMRDAVWRDLVARTRPDECRPGGTRPGGTRPDRTRPGETRADGTEPERTERQVWTVLAVGVALPGLTRVAARLASGWRGETADLDAEVLTGFVARLATLDISGRRVLGRLLDAAVRAGRRARAQAGDHDAIHVDHPWPAPPAQPWGHPDWVLARAVAAGVIDRTEARLIGATRLEDVPLADAAAALNVDAHLAGAWRSKAEIRLASAVTAGELDHVHLPRPARRTAQQARLVFARAARTRRRTALASLAATAPAGDAVAVGPVASPDRPTGPTGPADPAAPTGPAGPAVIREPMTAARTSARGWTVALPTRP